MALSQPITASFGKSEAATSKKPYSLKNASASPEALDISWIRTDGGTQPRAKLNPQVIEDYAEAMAEGAEFPPCIVFYDGSDYYLADGFHRFEAAKKAGLPAIGVDVRQGNRRDAVLFSVGANAKHGLRRSNADKRKVVLTLLRDSEWSQWSDGAIAKHCEVSQPFVSKLRRGINLTQNGFESEVQLDCDLGIPQPQTRKGVDGRTINTANLTQNGFESEVQLDCDLGIPQPQTRKGVDGRTINTANLTQNGFESEVQLDCDLGIPQPQTRKGVDGRTINTANLTQNGFESEVQLDCDLGIPQPQTRKGVDGRTINTANLTQNGFESEVQLDCDLGIPQPQTRKGVDGRTINTANIGKCDNRATLTKGTASLPKVKPDGSPVLVVITRPDNQAISKLSASKPPQILYHYSTFSPQTQVLQPDEVLFTALPTALPTEHQPKIQVIDITAQLMKDETTKDEAPANLEQATRQPLGKKGVELGTDDESPFDPPPLPPSSLKISEICLVLSANIEFFSDTQLKEIIKDAQRELNQRHHPKYFT